MKRIYHFAILMAVAIFALGTTSCQDDSTLSTDIVGNWKYEEGQTAYSAGLLLSLSGQQVLDTATVVANVSTLFKNSEMNFNADKTGTIKKNIVVGTIADTSYLATILSSITDDLINSSYTYSVSSRNVILDINNKKLTLKVISITDTQMQVAIGVTDFSNWTSAILGDKVAGLAESPAFNSIESLAASFGIFANPTITMVFTKK